MKERLHYFPDSSAFTLFSRWLTAVINFRDTEKRTMDHEKKVAPNTLLLPFFHSFCFTVRQSQVQKTFVHLTYKRKRRASVCDKSDKLRGQTWTQGERKMKTKRIKSAGYKLLPWDFICSWLEMPILCWFNVGGASRTLWALITLAHEDSTKMPLNLKAEKNQFARKKWKCENEN